MKTTTQISIIVPIYNAAKTLERCVHSIVNQDFTDWELLLINDGSSDDSLIISKELKSRDNRIKVFSQKKTGVSAARNLGLKKARGKYICFIDSDDYIESNYLSSLYKYREYDLVICGYYVDIYNHDLILRKQEKHIPIHLDLRFIKNKEVLENLFLKGMLNTNWNKLFKHQIIKNNLLQYKPYPINEDNIFMLEYLAKSSSIYTIQVPLYHWIRIDNRISSVDSIPQNILSIYNESHILTRKYLNNNNIADNILYYSYNLIILKYFSCIKNKLISNKHAYTKLKELHKNPLVKASYYTYKPKSKGDWLTHTLQKKGWFKCYYYIHQFIVKWKN